MVVTKSGGIKYEGGSLCWKTAMTNEKLEMPRIELGTSYMQSKRSTTELHPPIDRRKLRLLLLPRPI